VDHKPKLVEEAVTQKRPDQGCAARDRDVLAGLLLEIGDLLLWILPDDCLSMVLRGVVDISPPKGGTRVEILQATATPVKQ
jgi:hypothetical protein